MINTLVIGYGFAAKTFHLPFLNYLSEFQICGFVSSQSEQIQQDYPAVAVFNDLQDALEACQPDLVIVTTPNHLHAPQTEAALKAGAHVLVEKPFTLSSAEAEALVALANQQHKKLCVFHNRRFDGDFLTLKQLIAKNELGEIKRFESRFDRFRPEPKNRWRELAGPGSGIFWDLGPHLIDQCLQLFGVPEAVSAEVETLRADGQSTDLFELRLHYADKIAYLGSSPFQAGPTLRFDLQGTKGSYRKFCLDPQEQQLKDGVAFHAPQWAQTIACEEGEYSSEKGTQLYPTLQGGYLSFYQQLADAITNDGALPADASTVTDVIRVIELAHKAAEQGQRILWS